MANNFFSFSFLALLTIGAHAQENNQYYLDQIELPAAWDITRGSPEIKVAIIGTGVNYQLSELSESIEKNSGESGNGFENDGIDNDNNGYVDDVFGVNTHKNTGDPMDVLGSSTHVASLVASKTWGIAPNVKIIPIAVCDEHGACAYNAIVKGIEYAVSRQANLIQFGLGGYPSPSSFDQICNAIKNSQIPTIATAGNSAQDLSSDSQRERLILADCGADNVLIVAATNARNDLTSYTNFGFDKVHVAAPGDKIWGLNHYGDPVKYSGTTMASAIATGIAALVLSHHRNYTATNLKEALIRGSDSFEPLQEKIMSGGRVNALKALTAEIPQAF